jgi:hypothetical protein
MPDRTAVETAKRDAWIQDRIERIRPAYNEPDHLQFKTSVLQILHAYQWQYYDDGGSYRPVYLRSHEIFKVFRSMVKNEDDIPAYLAEGIRLYHPDGFTKALRRMLRENGWSLSTVTDPRKQEYRDIPGGLANVIAAQAAKEPDSTDRPSVSAPSIFVLQSQR